jgi:hypothetical protein
MRRSDVLLKASLLADEIGRTKAAVAIMTSKEEALKKKLRDLGVREAEGELFRVTIGDDVEYEVRDEAFKVLVEGLVARGTTAQYRAAHTEKKMKAGAVRVVARTRKEAA